jgi:hypothetical protein
MSTSRRKEYMRRGIRTRISQLMYRCLAQYLVNSALCVDIQLWSRHVASRPPEIPTERSGYSIGTVCGLAPQPEAVSISSIHLFICSSVHSLTPYLHQLDYNPSIEISIHIYSAQSPVKHALHLILSFVSDPTTPDSAHLRSHLRHCLLIYDDRFIPLKLHSIYSIHSLGTTRWETVSPTPLQNQKEKVKS